MKKITVVLLLTIIFSWVTFSHADEYDDVYTDGYMNGKTFDYETDDWEGDEWAYENDIYMYGVIDALFWTNYDYMKRTYRDDDENQEMLDMIRRYYRNNPSQKDKPIVKLILNGCR
ncbi:MAG: hypothetical protein P9X27_00895 [Candidatus Kaelpia aquatica]|nr:hypothetical protein [Candidatus Kaelpia aquatica]